MAAPPPRRNTGWAKVAVALLLVLVYREGVFHDAFRLYAQATKHPGDAPGTQAVECPDGASGGTSVCFPLQFAWNFKDREWTWNIAIPKEDHDHFAALSRPTGILGLAGMANASRDDAIIADLAGTIRDAAQAAGYSEYDTVSFALSFVQSMRYTPDTVGQGTDNYAQYPLETLVRQGGDCEDTSLLGAAILDALGHRTALLIFRQVTGYSGGHAALGVSGADLVGTFYGRGATPYYYAEMTSTGYPLGTIPDMVRGHEPLVIPV